MGNEKFDGLSRTSREVTVTVVETVEEEKIPVQQQVATSSSTCSKIKTAASVSSLRPLRASELSEASLESQRPAIPSIDNSKTAWQVLFGAILTQGMLFGMLPSACLFFVERQLTSIRQAFPLTFGVFQDYFSEHQRLSNSAHSIWIGVLSTGVPFIGAPFMTALCETRSPTHWRYYVLLGWGVCTVSLIAAAFAKRLLVLGITQGVLYGVGLMLLDVPVLLILNTWFIERRGLAYGLLFGTTDLLGFGATILAGHLLRHHNLKRTLLTFAGILLVISGPCMLLLRHRPAEPSTITAPLPATEPETEEAGINSPAADTIIEINPQPVVRYYRRPTFYIFALANLFHALAYYLPFLYLPTYATSLGLSSRRGAWLLAGANFAQIFGEIAFGSLSDGFNIHCLVLLCALISSVSALSLWGLAQSFLMLAFFALTFGAFGSGMIALWARMGTYFDQRDAQMIFSIMSFGRGFASIVSGPISSALEVTTAHRVARYGNGKYVGIVLFVGVSMGISAVTAIVGLVLTWRRNKTGRPS